MKLSEHLTEVEVSSAEIADSVRLLPCPFCGAGETSVGPDSKHWAGMSWKILSWQVRHWCQEPDRGVRGSMVIIRAKTEPEVIEKWNRRT